MNKDIKIQIVKLVDNFDENYRMAAFGDSADEYSVENYVILQRAYTFDKQDSKLGMDTYYFEFNNQANSGYGICEKVILNNNCIEFSFLDEENNICKLNLILDKDSYDNSILERYLSLILGDTFTSLNLSKN